MQNRKIIEGYHLYVWRVEGVEEEEKGIKVEIGTFVFLQILLEQIIFYG